MATLTGWHTLELRGPTNDALAQVVTPHHRLDLSLQTPHGPPYQEGCYLGGGKDLVGPHFHWPGGLTRKLPWMS